ncbi:MAG TPA: molybdopterin-dependent oxidoreductase [Actinomycetales bacterium]|nr:molybdopterin-dependent oxidoreductase [Actinomycetales bacterium]
MDPADRVTNEPAIEPPRALPPGQRLVHELPIMHYGPVPRPRPDRWNFTVGGETHDGKEHHLTWDELAQLPEIEVTADLHCATHWSVLDNHWRGFPAREVIELFPPADHIRHVVVYAEYGYAANVQLADLASPRAILATHHNGEPLTTEHGAPLRLIIPHLYSWKGPKWVRGWEYHTEVQRGFWEDRGYHIIGDAWREERYSHQE